MRSMSRNLAIAIKIIQLASKAMLLKCYCGHQNMLPHCIMYRLEPFVHPYGCQSAGRPLQVDCCFELRFVCTSSHFNSTHNLVTSENQPVFSLLRRSLRLMPMANEEYRRAGARHQYRLVSD